MDVLVGKLELLDPNWKVSLETVNVTNKNEDLSLSTPKDNKDTHQTLQGLQNIDLLINSIIQHNGAFAKESGQFIEQVQNLSTELNRIKQKSIELTKMSLENNTKLEGLKSQIDTFQFLSPQLIQNMLQGSITPMWCTEAETVISYQLNENQEEVALCNILSHIILERCKKKVIDSIRILRTFHPSQVVQKKLLEIKAVFKIIQLRNAELSKQLFKAYCNTMKWYYTQFFSRYIRSLGIMQYHQIDANYKFGGQLSYYYSMLTGVTGGAMGVISIEEYFRSVNKRIFILSQENSTVMVSQIAETNTMKNFLEIGFKNLNLCILNNYQVEREFINEFFQQASQESREATKSIFQEVFENSIVFTKNLTAYTFDFYGILLCIRISQIYMDKVGKNLDTKEEGKKTTQEDPFEEYLNEQLMGVLWPKFQFIINNNLNNTQDISLVQPDQFVNFIQGILIISNNYNIKIEPLYQSLMNILNNFETFNLQKTHAGDKTYHLNVYNKLLNLFDSLESIYNVDENVDGADEDDVMILKELKERYLKRINEV